MKCAKVPEYGIISYVLINPAFRLDTLKTPRHCTVLGRSELCEYSKI